MAGHVFLTRGDLTRLHCDAWLLPTSRAFQVTAGWRAAMRPELQDLIRNLAGSRFRHDGLLPEEWLAGDLRVLPASRWLTFDGAPCPYFVRIGRRPSTDISWYIDGARAFFEAVAKDLKEQSPLNKRAKHLVGLPVVGTGHGGAAAHAGAVVRELLPALYDATGRYDFDVVLVTASAAAFTAAQNVRRELADNVPTGGVAPWPELGSASRAEATRLAQHAIDGNLVLFLGAGVSAGAGLPQWQQLLIELMNRVGMREAAQTALMSLDVLDQARLISERFDVANPHLPRGRALRLQIAMGMQAEHFSLAHSLLANLPVHEVVTTNYDRLFEVASSTAGYDTRVLPYQRAVRNGRWLLKMHGSVDHEDDIVLSREDYMRYGERRAALSGIVQALLITRQMLFVGFSLADANFHRIVDDVRKAIDHTEHRVDTPGPLGTALFLNHDALLEELWRGELRYVSMTASPVRDEANAARILDMFLDFLLSEASRGVSPLLRDEYEAILTDTERQIRDLLRRLENGASEQTRASPAWSRVQAMLDEFRGGPA